MLSLLIPLLSGQGFHFAINLAGVHFFPLKGFALAIIPAYLLLLVESIGIADISDYVCFFH